MATIARRAGRTDDIERYRNPANMVIDTENCPRGDDTSMVPFTDE
mgnify:CR=1 FL=1